MSVGTHLPARAPSRSRGVLASIIVMALSSTGLACLREGDGYWQSTETSETTTPGSAPAASAVSDQIQPYGKVVSTTTTNTSVRYWTINGKTRLAVTVDHHPEIKRTFDFAVEVDTKTSTEKGVTRTEVFITKKDGGDVVEVIRL